MTQIFSFKSAAMLCVATLAMCCTVQDANAQCRGGGYGGFSPGFGGTSININRGGVSFGYTSGFRGGYGINNFNSFGGGLYNPGFVTPVYRGNNFYGGGFYGRPANGININYVSPRSRSYGYGYGHGHHHRR